MTETKLIEGELTWKEACAIKEKGWRLPTYFELLKLSEEGEEDNKWYWSSSPFVTIAIGAWAIYFNIGTGSVDNLRLNNHVRLVRSGQEFDYRHSVSVKEAIAFKETGELPDWHPSLEPSMAVL